MESRSPGRQQGVELGTAQLWSPDEVEYQLHE